MNFVSTFHIGLAVLGISATFFYADFYLHGVNTSIGNVVDFFQLLGIRLAHLVILCEAFYQQNTLISFFKNILEVDGIMQKLNFQIGNEFRRMKNTLKAIAAIGFYIGAMLVVLVTIVLNDRGNKSEYQYYLVYWISYIGPYFISCLRYYQSITMVGLIEERLEILNEKLAQLKLFEEEEFLAFPPVQPSVHFKLYMSEMQRPKPRHKSISEDFDKLILFREMFDKLYVASTIVNYSFGLSALINIANDFLAITLNSYFVFLQFQQNIFGYFEILRIIQSIFWSLPHAANILVLCMICYFGAQTVSPALRKIS